MSHLNDTTKRSLRLAAVGALLHNLGKINAKFLGKQINNANNGYLYQHILGLIAPHVSHLPLEWQNDYDAAKLTASRVLDNNTVTALKTTFNLPTPLDDRADYTIADLVEYLGQGQDNRWYQKDNGQYGIEYIFSGGSRLTHLMNRAHRGASGGEKEAIATAQQPDVTDLYLSTPFGYEMAAPNISDIDNLLQKIELVIQKYLTSPITPFPLADFVTELRPLLGQTLADTQRPLNDVTVGDIGHTGMAFLLTQAVERILTKRSIDHNELADKESANTLFWRVLTVHTDSLRYLEQASSLTDLRVRQTQLQVTFETICEKLEETLLAVKIYADEQRHLFLFPNLDQNSAACQVVQNVINNFSIDGLCLTMHLSDPVTNHPGDKNGIYIGDQVLKQLKDAPPYDFDAAEIAAFWSGRVSNKPLCTACSVRPQGYGAKQVEAYRHNSTYYQNKAEGRNICCICMDRRSGVAKKWANSELDTTVWLDEVADDNGRLALIVGQWSLKSFIQSHSYPHSNRSCSKTAWLHTIRFLDTPCPDQHDFTLNGQTYTWHAGQSILSGERELASLKQMNLNIHTPSAMKVTVQDIVAVGAQLSLTIQQDLTSTFPIGSQVKCWGQDFRVAGTHSLETVNNAARQKILSDVLWDATYPFIVQKARKVNILEITSSGEGAKNESFARLRRIWETTRTFWQEVLSTDEDGDLAQLLVGQIVDPAGFRLEIIPQGRDELDLDNFHTYELVLPGDVRLSVVWDSDKRRFITCDNLDYLAKPEQLGKPVQDVLSEGRTLTVEEPIGYGGENKVWGEITLAENAQELPGEYTPAIPILAEPRTFMALVPADKALDVIQAIKQKYEREMGKVRNRLPLHLGVVYFHRRTPLRAALDAGRRMLTYAGARDSVWTVEQDAQTGPLPNGKEHLVEGTRQFTQTITISLAQDSRFLTWRVPAVMGDGATEDVWYPYVYVEKPAPGKPIEQRTRRFKSVSPPCAGEGPGEGSRWLVHTGELQKDDQVYFTPATFDFEYLETTARRFEVSYKDGRRRGESKAQRTYLLDDLAHIEAVWQTLRDGLATSQIKALETLIESKRRDWEKPKGAQALALPDDDPFRRLCRDALANAEWRDERWKESKDLLVCAAVSGMLADALELHLTIAKESRKKENEEAD